MDNIEECREQARQHRGVWYDARAGKFAAEVYSKGDRHFLGHFPTAEEAASAYALARAELPIGRVGDDTFVQAFQSFLDTAKRDANGTPSRGEILTYKDQQFCFKGVVFRSMKGRKRPFYSWLSTCACGKTYSTMTATSPETAKGITRNCEEHRASGRMTKSAAALDRKTSGPDDFPQEWIDTAREATEALSLVSDSFHPLMFVRECWGPKGQPEGFLLFLNKSPQSPVILRNGKYFPRNL